MCVHARWQSHLVDYLLEVTYMPTLGVYYQLGLVAQSDYSDCKKVLVVSVVHHLT